MSEAGPVHVVPFLKARRSLKENVSTFAGVHRPKPCDGCIRPEHETKADEPSPPED